MPRAIAHEREDSRDRFDDRRFARRRLRFRMVPLGALVRYRSRVADSQAGARHAKTEFVDLPRVWALRDLEICSATADAGALPRTCDFDVARIRWRTRRRSQVTGAA